MGLFSKLKKSSVETEKQHTYADLLKEKESYIAQLEQELQHERKEKSDLYHKLQILETKYDQKIDTTTQLQNELQTITTNYSNLMDLFGYENQNLKFALLDLQKNMAHSTTRAKESLKASKIVEENFDKAFEDINIIVHHINDLLKRSHNVAGIIKGLSKKAIEIEKSIELINEVVMQIKILSLNASVEAASAGEAGKGFAVVATEVKNLANKTSTVATEIKNAVRSIQQSTQSTDQEFHQIDENIQSIHQNSNNFSNELHALNHMTKHSLAELNILGDNVFMSLAKLDHIIWKVNTYISTHEGKPAFNFVDHHNCRLGKWYFEGDGQKYFSHTTSYQKLDAPHSAVHHGTHKVFELIQQSPVNLASVKKAFESIEENSKKVFSILDDIMEEVLIQDQEKNVKQTV